MLYTGVEMVSSLLTVVNNVSKVAKKFGCVNSNATVEVMNLKME